MPETTEAPAPTESEAVTEATEAVELTESTTPTEPKPTETQPKPTETTPPTTEAPKPTEHTHSYSGKTVAATCTEGGYTTYTCSCGDSYTADATDALGHDWSIWIVTMHPSYEYEGEMTRTCSRCDKTETQSVDKLTTAVTEADIPELESYARQYAASIGFRVDYSLNESNAGFYPGGHIDTRSIEAAKARIRGAIDWLKENLIAAHGDIISECGYNVHIFLWDGELWQRDFYG